MFEYRPKAYPTRPEGGAEAAALGFLGALMLANGLDVLRALAIVVMGASWGGGALYLGTLWLAGLPMAAAMRHWINHRPASMLLWLATLCAQITIIATSHLVLIEHSPRLAYAVPAWLAGQIYMSMFDHLQPREEVGGE